MLAGFVHVFGARKRKLLCGVRVGRLSQDGPAVLGWARRLRMGLEVGRHCFLSRRSPCWSTDVDRSLALSILLAATGAPSLCKGWGKALPLALVSRAISIEFPVPVVFAEIAGALVPRMLDVRVVARIPRKESLPTAKKIWREQGSARPSGNAR